MFPLAGLFLAGGKRRRRWLTLGVLFFGSFSAIGALSGCGGGFALKKTSQTYTITVTGTSGATVQTTTVNLTVQERRHMRSSINLSFVLLAIAAVSLSRSAAEAQQNPAPPPAPTRAELAVGYSFVHSNAPPGDCGCFSLNGGGASFAWSLKPHFALVGDLDVTHAGSITSNGYSLTLSTYTAGARYSPLAGHKSLQPFGQVLVGAAHASGSLVEGRTPAASNAGASFAAIVGGGLDVRVARRFSLRLVEADYLVTTVDNGVNDHQNNLRIGAGVAFHF